MPDGKAAPRLQVPRATGARPSENREPFAAAGAEIRLARALVSGSPSPSIREASMIAHRVRRSLVLACLLAPLAWAAPLRGQEQPPFTIVQLDLNTRIAAGTLPFKEDFYLRGPAPAGSRSIAVRFRRSQPRDSVFRDSPTGICAASEGWGAPAPVSWLRSEPADTFYAHVPELKPNLHYAFCVSTTVRPVGDVLAAFRRQAARLLDQRLREVPSGAALPNPFPGELMREIKAGYVRALAEGTGRTVLLGPPGTLFDTLTTGAPSGKENELRDILRQQFQREEGVRRFEEEVGRVDGALVRLDTPLAQVVGNARLGSLAGTARRGEVAEAQARIIVAGADDAVEIDLGQRH